METGSLLVCVTRQVSCERLIHRGADLALEENLNLEVLHVVANGANLLGNPSEGEALDFLFTTAKQYNANMSVLRSENIIESISRFAREHKTRAIVLGESRQNIKEDDGIIWQLRALLPGIQVHVISSPE